MFPVDTKFLIVDDSSTMRKIVKNALIELGYNDTEEADDGSTAMPILQHAQRTGTPFQVIFCDSNMPIMKGIDLLKACKNDPYLKKIPFIGDSDIPCKKPDSLRRHSKDFPNCIEKNPKFQN